jgi:tetratricopeptide (TPR) repeat protein
MAGALAGVFRELREWSWLVALGSLVVAAASLTVTYRTYAGSAREREARTRVDAIRLLSEAILALGTENVAGDYYVPRDERSLAQAMSLCGQALALDPDNARANALMSALLAMHGERKVADELRLKALKAAPRDARVHVYSGAALARMGRKEEGLKEYMDAASLDDADWLSFHVRAVTEERAGQRVRAVQDYETAVGMNQFAAISYIDWAGALLEMGEFDKGIAICNRAQSRGHVKDARLLVVRAELLRKKKDLVGAEDAIAAALELDPQSPYALVAEATYLMQLGRMSDALPKVERALRIDPENERFRVLRDQILDQIGSAALRSPLPAGPAIKPANGHSK